MWRSTLISTIWILLYGTIAENRHSANKPHIILIIADDLGWNDVSFHGMTEILTPNIDALAAEGVILNNYYSCPMCTPSRASIFSGYYPHKTGLQNYVIPESGDWGLPLGVSTLPDELENLGYTSHLIGKWHLGFHKGNYTPSKRGFETHYGFWSGAIDFFEHTSESGAPPEDYKNLPENITSDRITLIGHDFHDGLKPLHLEGNYLTDLLTEKALHTIDNYNTSNPLFLCVAHHAVHRGNPLKPMYAPEKYTESYSFIQDDKRRNFAGALKALDDSVGLILESLVKKDMLKSSVVIFTSDNGADVEFVSSNGGSNWPLRGQKFSPWEGGVKALGLIWSSKTIDHVGVWNGLMHVVDWYPTILRIAGHDLLALPEDIDGKDMLSVISQNGTSPRNEIILSLDPIWNLTSLRHGDFKIVCGSFPYQDINGWYGTSGRDVQVNFLSKDELKTRTFLRKANEDDKPRRTSTILPINIYCGEKPEGDLYDCHPKISPCVFNVVEDPCEYKNLANEKPEVLKFLTERLQVHWEESVPPLTGKRDYNANPQFYNNEWISWLEKA